MNNPTHLQVTHSLSDVEFILSALEEYGRVEVPSEADFERAKKNAEAQLPDAMPDELKKRLLAHGRSLFEKEIAAATDKRDRSVLIRAQLIQAKRNPQEFAVVPVEISQN